MRVNFTKLLKQSNQTLKHLSYNKPKNKQIKLRKKPNESAITENLDSYL